MKGAPLPTKLSAPGARWVERGWGLETGHRLLQASTGTPGPLGTSENTVALHHHNRNALRPLMKFSSFPLELRPFFSKAPHLILFDAVRPGVFLFWEHGQMEGIFRMPTPEPRGQAPCEERFEKLGSDQQIQQTLLGDFISNKKKKKVVNEEISFQSFLIVVTLRTECRLRTGLCVLLTEFHLK